MSTKTKFGNKIVQLPGSYSRIVSASNNPPRDLDYGKLLIIDTNKIDGVVTGNGILGGSGIGGTLLSGANAVYHIPGIKEFKDFCPYGFWNKASEFLFNPDGAGKGISEIIVVKPYSTTPATMIFETHNVGAGGKLKINTRDEGIAANGSGNETRAHSSVTVTNAGATLDKITIKIQDITVAEYVNASNDTIEMMVANLIQSMDDFGLCEVINSDTTSLMFSAPVGLGGTTITPSIIVTGTATATATAFTGGVDSATLHSGYAYTIETGIIDVSKWIMKIWRGSYTGEYIDGIPYNEIAVGDSVPVLLAQSPEFNNMRSLIEWATYDSKFNNYFIIDDSSTVAGTGVIVSGDITPITGYKIATGGTFVSNKMDDTLEVIKELNYNYIIYSDSLDTINILKILDHIKNEAKYDKYLAIGGSDVVDTDVASAEGYDSERLNIVYGSIFKKSQLAATGFRKWSPFFHTCYSIGRLLGLRPEVPLTFKNLDIDGLYHNLTEKEKIKLDSAGVLATIYDSDFKLFINLHDVNTLQNNDFVLNADGTSHLIQIERIKSQLNKELIINSKLDLLSNPQGVNRSSLTEEDAIEWTKTQLQRKLGTLLISYKNVTAYTEEDHIFVNYEASPNTEIKNIFFTGSLSI